MYVISTIGSSEENVFKIGRTRRLEPLGHTDIGFTLAAEARAYRETVAVCAQAA